MKVLLYQVVNLLLTFVETAPLRTMCTRRAEVNLILMSRLRMGLLPSIQGMYRHVLLLQIRKMVHLNMLKYVMPSLKNVGIRNKCALNLTHNQRIENYVTNICLDIERFIIQNCLLYVNVELLFTDFINIFKGKLSFVIY